VFVIVILISWKSDIFENCNELNLALLYSGQTSFNSHVIKNSGQVVRRVEPGSAGWTVSHDRRVCMRSVWLENGPHLPKIWGNNQHRVY